MVYTFPVRPVRFEEPLNETFDFSNSTDILHHFYKDNHYRVLVLFLNSSPESLSPMANVALASSLARLGRPKGAVHFMVQLADSAELPSDRKLYLYALYRCLEENGGRLAEFAAQVENGILQEEAIEYVPRLEGVFFSPPPYLSMYEQVLKYEEAGGFTPLDCFSAAVKRDYDNSKRVADLVACPSKIFPAIDEFGPWYVLQNAIINQFKRSRSAMEKLILLAGPGFLGENQELSGVVQIASARAAAAVINFITGDYLTAFLWIPRYFAAVDLVRHHSLPSGIIGVTPRDVTTMAIIMANCIERGIQANPGTLERIYTRLVHPDAGLDIDEASFWASEIESGETSCLTLIQLETLSLLSKEYGYKNPLLSQRASMMDYSLSLRKSQVFLCCGHLRRQLAANNGVRVLIALESGQEITAKRYSPTECFEAARLYILAAANHPLDDPHLYRLYDRIIWVLGLAGGIHAKTLWLFLHARNWVYYAGNFVPASNRAGKRPSGSLLGRRGTLSRRPKSEGSITSSVRPQSRRSNSSDGLYSLRRIKTIDYREYIPIAPDFQPVKKCKEEESVGQGCSGAILSPWPHYKNLEQTLYMLHQFVNAIYDSVNESDGFISFDQYETPFLSPSIYEYSPDGKTPCIYMLGEYLPNQTKLVSTADFHVSPELRPQIKLLTPTIEEQYNLSKQLVQLWAGEHLSQHEFVPEWSKDVLQWAGAGHVVNQV